MSAVAVALPLSLWAVSSASSDLTVQSRTLAPADAGADWGVALPADGSTAGVRDSYVSGSTDAVDVYYQLDEVGHLSRVTHLTALNAKQGDQLGRAVAGRGGSIVAARLRPRQSEAEG
jgi:hypothetical protein